MNFQEVVRRRKMVRSFADRPVPDEVVELLLENALRAPSAGFSQGWAFLILKGGAETGRYWEAHRGRGGTAYSQFPLLFNAPVIIVCLSHRQAYTGRYGRADKRALGQPERVWPVPYWDVDTGMAALLILLTAVDNGLGALLFEVPRQDAVKAAFGVPAEYTAMATIAVGDPTEHVGPPGSDRRRERGRPLHYGQWPG